MKIIKKIILPLMVLSLTIVSCLPQEKTEKPAEKPLYRDPVYDGAADPVVVWNKQYEKWFMYYTNRRANIDNEEGVSWVHGSRIGVAESDDGGASWKYRDTCDIKYRPNKDYTFWAPDIVYHKDIYHMFLTYVPGIFSDWSHPRIIVHLNSRDGISWDFVSEIKLASEKVLDASLTQLPDGSWRMWYNNERDKKSMYYADSKDLYEWTDIGKAKGIQRGEGAKVFKWKGKIWMIVDEWKGLAIYTTEDYESWTRQAENILQNPGTGIDDMVKGGHCDVVINDDRAYIFYFTHPGRRDGVADSEVIEKQRSSIQLAELHYEEGKISCDRNQAVYINLKKSE